MFFFLVIAVLVGGFGQQADAAVAVLDYSEKFQTIEGFGGGMSFHIYPYNHPRKEAMYDSIFNRAKINVIRVGNWYDPRQDTPDVEIPMMKEIQQRWPEVKTILASWSPPPYLKSNNSLAGFDGISDTGTLRKKPDSTYMYKEYADYWLKSARHFTDSGMKVDWISIQNEPDWPAGHEGCVLEGRETPTIASYGKAHTAVYNLLKDSLDTMIPMIGPDVAGIYLDRVTRFITSPETNLSEMTAYCHHLYDHPGVDWFVETRAHVTGKPIYQTEFLINEGKQHGDKILTWLDHAWFIHQSLAVEGVSMYCLFALAYKPASTHCFFSMDTLGGDWYETRNAYYMFKQFSANIRRGWKRILAECDDQWILTSAYCDADNDSTALIFINQSTSAKSVYIEFAGKRADVIQTSDIRKYAYTDSHYNRGNILLDPLSVTTVNLHNDSTVTRAVTSRQVSRTGSSLRIAATESRPVVTVSAPKGKYTLSLFDCRGNRIMSRPVYQSAPQTVHLFNRRLTPGSYFVTLSDGRITASAKTAVIH